MKNIFEIAKTEASIQAVAVKVNVSNISEETYAKFMHVHKT